MMLTNKKSTSKSWLKPLALLPIVGVTLALNAETVNDYVYEEVQQQPQAKIVKKGKNNAQVKMRAKTVEVKEEKETEAEQPLEVVEEMPKFPGGDEGLMKFIQENVKYPEKALKTGSQGRVIVKFIVEKDGSISGAEVIKKVNEHLDAEALRVINAMPKWTPGKQKGKVVRAKFVLPVTFRLH